jgi:hypothetical protein
MRQLITPRHKRTWSVSSGSLCSACLASIFGKKWLDIVKILIMSDPMDLFLNVGDIGDPGSFTAISCSKKAVHS